MGRPKFAEIRRTCVDVGARAEVPRLKGFGGLGAGGAFSDPRNITCSAPLPSSLPSVVAICSDAKLPRETAKRPRWPRDSSVTIKRNGGRPFGDSPRIGIREIATPKQGPAEIVAGEPLDRRPSFAPIVAGSRADIALGARSLPFPSRWGKYASSRLFRCDARAGFVLPRNAASARRRCTELRGEGYLCQLGFAQGAFKNAQGSFENRNHV